MGVYSLLFTKKICNLQNQDAAVHTCSENRHALSLKRNDGSSAFSRWKKLKVNGSVLIRRPVKTLPAAVTKLLVLPFHRYTALRTYRKAVASMKAAETVDTANPHGTAKQHGAVRFRNQKLIGRLLKSRAQLFQGIDRRSRFAPCDIPKYLELRPQRSDAVSYVS